MAVGQIYEGMHIAGIFLQVVFQPGFGGRVIARIEKRVPQVEFIFGHRLLFLGPAPIQPLWGAALEDAACGGICSFEGRVREEHLGRKVLHLSYEAYESLAWRELRRLAADARGRWDLGPVVIAHRIGRLEIGETAVLIAVASGHRDAAFEACRFLIEGVKAQVPIWKHEFYADGGEAWVAAPGWQGMLKGERT